MVALFIIQMYADSSLTVCLRVSVCLRTFLWPPDTEVYISCIGDYITTYLSRVNIIKQVLETAASSRLESLVQSREREAAPSTGHVCRHVNNVIEMLISHPPPLTYCVAWRE